MRRGHGDVKPLVFGPKGRERKFGRELAEKTSHNSWINKAAARENSLTRFVGVK